MTTQPDPARARFMALTMLRFAAALLVSFGLVIALGNRDWLAPRTGLIVGMVMVAVGLFDLLILVPRLLRRWRSGG